MKMNIKQSAWLRSFAEKKKRKKKRKNRKRRGNPKTLTTAHCVWVLVDGWWQLFSLFVQNKEKSSEWPQQCSKVQGKLQLLLLHKNTRFIIIHAGRMTQGTNVKPETILQTHLEKCITGIDKDIVSS